MRTVWTFHSAGKIVFGPGCVRQLGELCGEQGLTRLLVVTDAPLVSASVLEEVRHPLERCGVELLVFADGEPEPSLALGDRCAEFARSFRPQGLLGLGGGSNMDLAKITATILTHGGSARDYIGDSVIPGPVMPLICVPTTAGTGSEVTASSVLTDQTSHMKVGVLSNHLRPALALVDPNLTFSCPSHVTADSGIDALSHAIEAFTAIDNESFAVPEGEKTVYQGRHPLGDCLAERAIELIGQHLVHAVDQPDNLPAREGMALAAMLAGLAFSNVGVALVHAMEYPVGGAVHCSHGRGNGLLLPYVMQFNLPYRHSCMARIAQLLGVETVDMPESVAAQAAIVAVERLRDRIGIPGRLSELGVQRGQLPDFADKASCIHRILRVNPRPVTRDDILAIYQEAF